MWKIIKGNEEMFINCPDWVTAVFKSAGKDGYGYVSKWERGADLVYGLKDSGPTSHEPEDTLNGYFEAAEPVAIRQWVEEKDKGGWTQWNGGDCPVESGTMVDVMLRDGSVFNNKQAWASSSVREPNFQVDGSSEAGWAFWRNDGQKRDIVAWRLHGLKEEEALQDTWIDWKGGECPVAKGTLVDVKLRSAKEVVNQTALVNGICSYASSPYWIHDGIATDIIAYRLHRPEQTAWNGDGLPPVGIECEYHSGYVSDAYYPCEIIAHFEGENETLAAYVFTQQDGTRLVGQGSYVHFRPIRTELERKRDEFTDACIDLDSSQDWSHSTDYFRGLYNAIAAGKIPGIKLEG